MSISAVPSPGEEPFIWFPDGSLSPKELVAGRYRRLSGQASRPNDSDLRTTTEKDRDRVAYSGYLQRLAGITQVVSPHIGQPQLHSRLTHTYKVALVSRAIASDVLRKARASVGERDLLLSLGGLDIAACEAAGLAHDLGHPPFGHIGERVLDAWLLKATPEDDGFEGNAQTTRIITRLDQRKAMTQGLDLAAVTIAAILKYPWLRDSKDERKSAKFSIYRLDDSEELQSLTKGCATAKIGSEIQTLEASVMDLADDVTYAMHDLQDFYQVGLIDMGHVLDELERTISQMDRRGGLPQPTQSGSVPHNHFEDFGLSLKAKYDQYFDGNLYYDGLESARDWLQHLERRRFDGSLLSIAALRDTFSKKIGEYLSRVVVTQDPAWPGGPHLSLEVGTWHEMQILKHVARHYVVETPLIGLHQQAQRVALQRFLDGALKWVRSSADSRQLPEPLKSFLANRDLPNEPEGLVRRAIVDYACTLSDEQCFRLSGIFGGNELPMVAML